MELKEGSFYWAKIKKKKNKHLMQYLEGYFWFDVHKFDPRKVVVISETRPEFEFTKHQLMEAFYAGQRSLKEKKPVQFLEYFTTTYQKEF